MMMAATMAMVAATTEGIVMESSGVGDRPDWRSDEEEGEDDTETHVPEAKRFYSWDNELNLAFRCPVGDDGTSKRGLCMPLHVQGKHGDPFEAKWQYGKTLKVPGWTLQRYLALEKSRDLWAGAHQTTHHALVIKQRVGGQLFLRLYEQGGASSTSCPFAVGRAVALA